MEEEKVLQKVQSICPVCRRVLDAAYIAGEKSVYFEKVCPEHGRFRVLAGNDPEEWQAWARRPAVNVPPKEAVTRGSGESQCPLHCGVCTDHLQTACCVLIDLTDRCDQYCAYCFAAAGGRPGENGGSYSGCAAPPGKGEPSLREIEEKLDLLLRLGEEREFNLQLSGGEPAVREDLPEIIALAKKKGFAYVQINTNGKRIALEDGYAEKLRDAGATVIYLQFDGLNDRIYRILRQEPLLAVKKKAVERCRAAGLPVILVPSVLRDVNLDQTGPMYRYLLENLDTVKGIHFQPMSFFGRRPEEQGQRVTMFDIMEALEEQTGGEIKKTDLCSVSTGHPLCCFYGTFRKQGDRIINLVSEETRRTGVSCCGVSDPLEITRKDRDFVLNKWETAGAGSRQESCCCSGETPAAGCCDEEISASGCCGEETAAAGCRGTDASGCRGTEEPGCCDAGTAGGRESGSCCDGEEVLSFDAFLRQLKNSIFTLSAMAFMDETNLDAERLKRCRVQQLSPDGRLIPFCAYNSIYREGAEG